jgi:ABC-type polysaccharide/polyol phosphate transport system ATPase subunit
MSDIVSMNELTLILKIISQCDIKCILTFPIKTIATVLKVSTYIITSITACPIGLAARLAIMSVSTSITAIILYIVEVCDLKEGYFQQYFSHIVEFSLRQQTLIVVDENPIMICSPMNDSQCIIP